MLRFVASLCVPLALVCGVMLVAGMLAGRGLPLDAVFTVAVNLDRSPQRGVSVLRLVDTRTAVSVEVTRHLVGRRGPPLVIPSEVTHHVRVFRLTNDPPEVALVDLRSGASRPSPPLPPSGVIVGSADGRLLLDVDGQLMLSRAGLFSAYLPPTRTSAWLRLAALPLADVGGEPLTAASDTEALFLPDGGLLLYSAGVLHAFDSTTARRARFSQQLSDASAIGFTRYLLAYVEAQRRVLVRIAEALYFVDTTTAEFAGPLVTDLNPRGLFSPSPEGTHMIVGTNTGFVLLDLRSGASETLVIGEPREIRWSPDGAVVVLAYRPDTMTGEIWLSRFVLEGESLTTLSQNYQLAMSWSAGGRYLAYSEGLAAQPISLCVHDVLTAATTCEESLPPLSTLTWDEERDLLYFAQPFQSVTTGGDGRLYAYDPATGRARALTPAGEIMRSFSVMRWPR